MESEQSMVGEAAFRTPGTSSTTPASLATPDATGTGAGANQRMVGLSQDPATREQILRDRYLKGLQKRKCTVCGNTARARCPFHACKTCCSAAKNPCTVHVLKPGKNVPEQREQVRSAHDLPTLAQSEQAWFAHNMPATAGAGYLRPRYTMPSPYNSPTSVQMGMAPLVPTATAANTYMASGRRSWATTAAMDQQELQRQKNIRVASREEAIMKNLWRLQRMRDHQAGEVTAEDEAFDRYILNSLLLQEVFALTADGLQGTEGNDPPPVKPAGPGARTVEAQKGEDSSMLDVMRVRLAADPQRKELSRQRLKQIIHRALRKLRLGDQNSDVLDVDEDETFSMGLPVLDKRWDSKHSKTWSEKSRQVLKTLEMSDTLLQKISDIRCPEDVQACVDLYKNSLGKNLNYLVPNLYPREEDVNGCSSSSCGNSEGTSCDGSLVSPRTTMLNYLSGAFLEPNTAGRVVVSNRSKALARCRQKHKIKERPWESGVEQLERLHWHRKYARGQGYWKVNAHDETLQGMCFERANAHTTIMEL